jgi:nucleotide-binding universal stress UspA family protein
MDPRMKVVVAYDGSDCADAALNDLSWAGLPVDAEIRVLTVYETSLLDPDSRHASAVQDAAVATSERAAARLRRALPGRRVTAHERAGSAASCILEQAHAWQADLIVLGSHGRSAIGRAVLGSVSHHVATHAHCSVRVARQEQPPERETARIVVGLDGSPESELALRAVAEREWPAGSRARLVTAMHVPVPEEFRHLDLLEHSEARLRGALEHVSELTKNHSDRLSASGLSIESVQREGEARKVLVEEAAALRADAIFVGVRPGHRLGRFVLGSVSAAVTTTAHCSVEVVRDPDG